MNTVQEIEVTRLHPNPKNPRLDLGDLTELASSIAKNGLYQNLTAYKGYLDEHDVWHDEDYTLLIGHRRCAAAKLANLQKVPCVIVDRPSELDQQTMMLQENMQRNELTLEEQAFGFQYALDLGASIDDIAEKSGFSKTTITHRLKIAELDKDSLKSVPFQLSIGDYTELSKIKDLKKRNEILNKAENSSNLKYQITNAINDERAKAGKENIVRLLENAGIAQNPQIKDSTWQYNGKYKIIKTYSFFSDYNITELGIKVDPKYSYAFGYNNVSVIIPQPKKPLTPEEKKANALKKRCAELDEAAKAISEKVLAFMYLIFAKKIPIKIDPSDELKLTDKTINLMLKSNCYSTSYAAKHIVHQAYTTNGTALDDAKKEEIFNSMQPFVKALALCIENQRFYFHDRFGSFVSKPELMETISILRRFGFTLEPDDLTILDGTHPLYQPGPNETSQDDAKAPTKEKVKKAEKKAEQKGKKGGSKK